MNAGGKQASFIKCYEGCVETFVHLGALQPWLREEGCIGIFGEITKKGCGWYQICLGKGGPRDKCCGEIVDSVDNKWYGKTNVAGTFW